MIMFDKPPADLVKLKSMHVYKNNRHGRILIIVAARNDKDFFLYTTVN